MNYESSNVPITLLFITGWVRSGKTFTLKAIVQQIKLCYKPWCVLYLNQVLLKITALTGVTARLVNGRTLHSALWQGIQKGSAVSHRQLTSQRLEDMTRRWKTIRSLIVDKISKVSYEMLRNFRSKRNLSLDMLTSSFSVISYNYHP